ncbi:MAG: aminotransferase class V-fold PLP-dependent enzyme, partial [Deferrisomatales bacterium]
MIPCQRHLFDIPGDVAYLNFAYMSPQLRSVTEAGRAAAARKAAPWRIGPADFFTGSERARGLFGRLVGAGADEVAIVPSASYGIEVAAANLPVGPGRRILVLQDQFPSNVYPWRELAARQGG